MREGHWAVVPLDASRAQVPESSSPPFNSGPHMLSTYFSASPCWILEVSTDEETPSPYPLHTHTPHGGHSLIQESNKHDQLFYKTGRDCCHNPKCSKKSGEGKDQFPKWGVRGDLMEGRHTPSGLGGGWVSEGPLNNTVLGTVVLEPFETQSFPESQTFL